MKPKLSIFSRAGIIALLLTASQLQAQDLTPLSSGTTKDLYGVATPSSQIS